MHVLFRVTCIQLANLFLKQDAEYFALQGELLFSCFVNYVLGFSLSILDIWNVLVNIHLSL